MSKVYFTSDLHLGHERLCRGIRNMSAEESNNLIIENWNKVINKKDIVYILGDVVMEKPQHLELLKQLKGTIKIIGGNHDNAKVCKVLNSMGIVIMGTFKYQGFICTHIPIHPHEVELFRGNIHGHIHTKGITEEWKNDTNKDLGPKYFNVNTEFHNYTPVLFSDIEKHFIALN